MGVLKTKINLIFPGIAISWFIHTLTPKFNPSKFLNPQQNQLKIQSHPFQTLYRISYRKISYFSCKTISPILKINNQTFPKPHSSILVSSLLISTFYDTHFLIKLYTIYSTSQHLPTRGTLKPSHYPLPNDLYH